MIRPRKYRRSSNNVLHRQVRALDELAAYEEFKASLLPALKKDLDAGMSAEEILEKYKAVAAARIVSETVKDTGYTAAQDVLNRTIGKPVERKVHKHLLDDIKEEDLDALLITQIKEVTSGEE